MKSLLTPLILSLFAAVTLGGCGVKGKPLPPLTPPVLGRGEPNYSRATQDLKLPKNSNSKNTDDWDDDSDFSEKKK